MSAESDAAKKHFDECGPFCEHIVFCSDCCALYGHCGKHGIGEDIRFKRSAQNPPRNLEPAPSAQSKPNGQRDE